MQWMPLCVAQRLVRLFVAFCLCRSERCHDGCGLIDLCLLFDHCELEMRMSKREYSNEDLRSSEYLSLSAGMAHQQHQAPPQPTAAAAAAAAEPSFNPFAPTTHSAPTQQGHTAAMSGWGAPTPTPPTAAPAASGDGAFDFTSFGDQAFGAAAPQSHLPGSKPPATAPAPAGNSSSPNPWGENAF